MKTATSPFSEPQEFENLSFLFIETGVEYVKLGYSVQSLILDFLFELYKELCSSNCNFKKCTVFKSVHCYLDVKTSYSHSSVCTNTQKSP